ncbi:MAG: hypothetical protein Q7R73_04760 [bacterium]|nr:hypothetical protein [bacterium]
MAEKIGAGYRIKNKIRTACADTALDIGKFFRKGILFAGIVILLYLLGLGFLELGTSFRFMFGS